MRCSTGSLFAWDTRRAAAAVGPAIQEAIVALGSKALRDRTTLELNVSGQPFAGCEVLGVASQCLRGVAMGCAEKPPTSRAASALQVALALAASVISVLLYAPALRFVHAFWLQLNPPEWAADYITPSGLATAAMHCQLVLPLLTAMLWVGHALPAWCPASRVALIALAPNLQRPAPSIPAGAAHVSGAAWAVGSATRAHAGGCPAAHSSGVSSWPAHAAAALQRPRLNGYASQVLARYRNACRRWPRHPLALLTQGGTS